jgi:hypothetical protein
VDDVVVGESHHSPAGGDEGRVAAAVGLEGGAGAVGLPSVRLDDEAVGRPVEVGLQARVVEGNERKVALWLGEARLADEAQEDRFQLAAGELRLPGGRSRQGRSPLCPFDLLRPSAIAVWSESCRRSA